MSNIFVKIYTVFAVKGFMLRYLFLVTLFVFHFSAIAQKADSIYVVNKDGSWAIRHKVKAGDNVMSVARRYHAPPAMVADMNNFALQQELTPNTRMLVPVAAYNLLTERPTQPQEARPIYYKVAEDDNLRRIARTTGVTQRKIQEWNRMDYLEITPGQRVLVGWVMYDNTNMTSPPVKSTPPATTKAGVKVEQDPFDRPRNSPSTVETIVIPQTDTVKLDTLSAGEKLYLEQTSNGTMVAEEKGTGAFFKRAGRSTNGIYFAFHNTARRGTIIKIYNPGTQKTVYAKVLGKLPVNEAFHNALFGISSDAKAELMTGANKVWCEISYAP